MIAIHIGDRFTFLRIEKGETGKRMAKNGGVLNIFLQRSPKPARAGTGCEDKGSSKGEKQKTVGHGVQAILYPQMLGNYPKKSVKSGRIGITEKAIQQKPSC